MNTIERGRAMNPKRGDLIAYERTRSYIAQTPRWTEHSTSEWELGIIDGLRRDGAVRYIRTFHHTGEKVWSTRLDFEQARRAPRTCTGAFRYVPADRLSESVESVLGALEQTYPSLLSIRAAIATYRKDEDQ